MISDTQKEKTLEKKKLKKNSTPIATEKQIAENGRFIGTIKKWVIGEMNYIKYMLKKLKLWKFFDFVLKNAMKETDLFSKKYSTALAIVGRT